MTVKRYVPEHFAGEFEGMTDTPDGDWVRWEDYEALHAKVTALVAALDECSMDHPVRDPFTEAAEALRSFTDIPEPQE